MNQIGLLVLIAILSAASVLISLWNTIKIYEMGLAINSRLDRTLLNSTGDARAAGIEKGRSDEVLRNLNEERHKRAEPLAHHIKYQREQQLPLAKG